MRKLREPESRFLAKLTPETRKKKAMALLVVVAVLVVIGAMLLVHSYMSPNHQISRKLTRLNKPQATCEQIRNELGAVSADSYSIDLQKKVLEKQMLCFSDALQFDKAIAAAKSLDVIYTKENDTANKARIETRIQNMKDTQTALTSTNGSSGNAQQQ